MVQHNQREMENDFSFAPDLVKASSQGHVPQAYLTNLNAIGRAWPDPQSEAILVASFLSSVRGWQWMGEVPVAASGWCPC